MPYEHELINHEGKLAMYISSWDDQDQPLSKTWIFDSKQPIEDWPELEGRIVFYSSWPHGQGWVTTRLGRTVIIDHNSWEGKDIVTPVPRPRNGKEYGWEWRMGKWTREYFPRCGECRRYHDPSFPYCDTCGECHKGKCKA